MRFLAKVTEYDKPTCNPEKYIIDAVKQFHDAVLDGEMAVDRLKENLHDLARVCNRNKLGAKIEVRWADDIRMLSFGYKCLSPFVWIRFYELKDQISALDVERMVDECIHSEDLFIFDQFMAEKKGGAE